jgi:4-hydroxybenzoate polyprenyltransferase
VSADLPPAPPHPSAGAPEGRAPSSASADSAWRALWSVGRWHIVAIASLGLLTFGWLFTGERLWWLAAICALDWFLVNLLNRVVDLPEDLANHIPATGWVARHRRPILWSGLSALTGSLLVLGWLAPALLPWRLAYHALGLAYNWPLLPGGRRIKALYFWKNTASATGFMLTVFGYPLAWVGLTSPDIGWGGVAALGVFFFLFELSYEVIYDLRDAPGDAAAGVQTYPVVHGEGGARRIIGGLLLGSLVAVWGGFGAGLIPWRGAIMGVAPLMQWGVYRAWTRGGRQLTSADCIGLTWLGAALLAAYHVWEVLGLPGSSAWLR